MTDRRLHPLLAISLSLCVWSSGVALPALASDYCLTNPSHQQAIAEMAAADAIYLGETHDRSEDHRAQLSILQALHQQNPNLAIGMEMFQRPFQGVLDAYLAGEITETELVEGSEWRDRWGFPWEDYAPILRFAREQGIPVLALNAPAEVTRKVSRQGLAALTPEERQWIPPLEEIDLSDRSYKDMLRQIFDEIHQGQGGGDFDRFFLVQVLWDETMAEGVANFLQNQGDRRVVVIAGAGHVVYGYGIPNRVARRMSNRPDFQQRRLLFQPAAKAFADSSRGEKIADYVWTCEAL